MEIGQKVGKSQNNQEVCCEMVSLKKVYTNNTRVMTILINLFMWMWENFTGSYT